MTNESNLLLAFYGDDITGSTDALDGLARNGVPSVLFIEPPTPADLEQFEDVRAVGVAGTSRAMTPAEMDDTLPGVFRSLRDLNPPLVHYKVCSTFDSAPDLGSIGKAIDIGQRVFESPFVPISQATTSPHGRYVVFGNLFAESDDTVYRLDRHPTMSTHPRTPMTESDLRRHLEKQTTRPIGLIDVRHLTSSERAAAALERVTSEEDAELIVLDALENHHLETIGRLLWSQAADHDPPLFTVGSSGLEHDALPAHWNESGVVDTENRLLRPQEPTDAIVVMSGSAAPTTASQITAAEDAGFETVRLDSARLIDPSEAPAERERAVEETARHLDAGNSIVLYSAKGPDDIAIKRTRHRYNELDRSAALADLLGEQQGRIVHAILETTDIDRACVAGGDTSGSVIDQLDITALEPIAPVARGAPLCRARSDNPVTDGLEIAFKGGQTGDDAFFSHVLNGGRNLGSGRTVRDPNPP